MNQIIEFSSIQRKLLFGLSRSSLSLLISLLFLPVGGRYALSLPGSVIAQTQQPTATEQEATSAAAQRLFAEGLQLYQQGTAESLGQAIVKWEEALPLLQRVG
ncbi:hypothetical protein [Lyngbya aestuarii]|uniref:hypothetical protein n=1 Tax=Lyngbya aestuarii TaxID=118322 RepID=UPI00403DFA6F